MTMQGRSESPSGRPAGWARPPSRACSRTPSSSWSGAGCTARPRTASTSATLVGGDPVGVLATTSQQALLAIDADCVVYSPLMADPDEVVALLRAGQERRHAARLVLPDPATDRAPRTPRARRAGVDAARHRHPPRRDHRAVPADGLGAVGGRHPRAGRGVLRHPHLRRPRRHPRLDAVRQDARGGPDEHHGRRSSAPGSASRCGWSPTSWASTSTRAAHDPRDGGGDRADRLAHRRRSSPAWSPASGSAGRARSTAAGGDRRGELVHGRRAPRPAVGGSAPSGERFEVEVTGDPSVPLDVPRAAPGDDRGRARPQPRHRRHRQALRQRRSRTSSRPSPASRPTSTCRSWPAARHRTSHGDGPMTILDRFRLDGKVAIVTGGGQGIGGASPSALAEAGADVVLGGPHRGRPRRGRRAGRGPRPAGARRADRRHRRGDSSALVRRRRSRVRAARRRSSTTPAAAMPRAAMDTSEGFIERRLPLQRDRAASC